MNYSYEQLAKMIDHSLLNPVLSDKALQEGIEIARRYDTASVCIMPFALKTAVDMLRGTDVLPTTTVGFPHGANSKTTKLFETEQAIDDGAKEIDMVVNISRVLGGEWNPVKDEIVAITKLAHEHAVKVKVIFENCYLNEQQKVHLCIICNEADVDWVKTSTGYGTGGAEISDLLLMRKHAAASVQVKAAGGIRTLDRLIEIRQAGCTRAGATATAAILDEYRERMAAEARGLHSAAE